MNIRYILPLLTLMAASCATPQVVTQLIPEAPEGKFEMGREYIPLNNDSIDIELGFDGINGEHLVFDLVVVNRTPDTLFINPSDFYYEVLDSATAASSMYPQRMAVHPERILSHYEESLEERHDQKSVNTIFGFIEAGIGLIAGTTGFIATEDPGIIIDAVLNTLGTAETYVSADRAIGEEIDAITKEKEIVQEEIFRSLQLPPGKVASGYVYFPRYEQQGYLMFCFPLENQLFQFVYNQKQFYKYD
jgi:hypothetical protein